MFPFEGVKSIVLNFSGLKKLFISNLIFASLPEAALGRITGHITRLLKENKRTFIGEAIPQIILQPETTNMREYIPKFTPAWLGQPKDQVDLGPATAGQGCVPSLRSSCSCFGC